MEVDKVGPVMIQQGPLKVIKFGINRQISFQVIEILIETDVPHLVEISYKKLQSVYHSTTIGKQMRKDQR